MNSVGKALITVGWITIVLGVIGGSYIFSQIDWGSYKIAKEVADKLFDNEFAQQAFQAAHTVFYSQISLGLSILFGGIVSGLVLQGLGTIIELLSKLVSNSTREKAVVENKTNITA